MEGAGAVLCSPKAVRQLGSAARPPSRPVPAREGNAHLEAAPCKRGAALICQKARCDPIGSRRLALFLTSVVEGATSKKQAGVQWTRAYCRRWPNRRKCTGEITARINRNPSHIEWICPFCQDRGEIYGWENTLWDKRKRKGKFSVLPQDQDRA